MRRERPFVGRLATGKVFQPFSAASWRRFSRSRGDDGVELACVALARWPELKVILTFGFPEIRVGNNGEKLTGLRLLTKPYRREELARIIRETLDADAPGGIADAVHLPAGRGGDPRPVSGARHARGKWFTIDIHCHVLTRKAEEMIKAAGVSPDWQPRHHFANELIRQVNREQAEHSRVQFSSIEKRLADIDLMGIDIQAITPSPAQTYNSVDLGLGIATARVINDNTERAAILGRNAARLLNIEVPKR